MANRSGSATLARPNLNISIDAAGLTPAQRLGEACVSCSKRWPRPRVRIGAIAGGGDAMACPECGEGLAASVRHHAVRAVLRGAADRADRYAPDLLGALIAAEPPGHGDGPRHAVEHAAVLVAQHIEATEDFGGREVLPPEVTEWEHAYAWLTAWRATQPPAAELREILLAVHAALVGADRG